MKPKACSMKTIIWMAGIFAGILCVPKSHSANSAVALSGVISSKEEGHMEGVLLSAKREGSKISVTVVSDSQGRYTFPGERLEPGSYRLRIRAVGYDLEDPGEVKVDAGKTARLDLALHKTKDLASQLSAAEWLMSAPGTPDQKMFGGFCIQCHTLEKVFRSKHDANAWMPVLQRMVNYSAASLFEPGVFKPILNPYKKVLKPDDKVGGNITLTAKELAEYLSSINLSSSKDGNWAYELKTLPRPTGRATKVIVTEYDLPRREVQNHDAIVDREGIVWYSDISGGYLGRLNPKTGEVKEWKTPLLKPGSPEGALDIQVDQDGNVWLGMRQQGGISRFDRQTETFQAWSAPPAENVPDINTAQLAINRDGTVWFKNSSTRKAYLLDPKTDKMVTYDIPADARGYGHAADSHGNFYTLELFEHTIGEVNRETRKMATYPVPTPKSGPRRGKFDSQDRLWFGLYYAGKLGMFDTKTKQFKEWTIPPAPYSGCYYAVFDEKNGDAWCGSELTDHAHRLDPATGQVTAYLLPTLEANIQRIDVDNSTTPVTVWVGEAHQAKIAKIEPLD
jgi:streptogramin lyase